VSGWVFAPPFVVMVTHWATLFWAARLLPGERRRLGDPRPAPDLLDPLTSYRWWAILLSERTDRFRPQARLAFKITRISILMIPVALLVSLFLVANFPVAEAPSSGRESPPSVTIDIPR
jgi:hypothetical protein